MEHKQADAAEIPEIINEGMRVLAPGLPVPVVRVVNHTRSGWLGRCTYKGSEPGNTKIELQKAIVGDTQTLRRVIFHELAHHEDFLKNWEPLPMVEKSVLRRLKTDGHGPEWRAIAARFNAIYGPGFVTKKSDQAMVVEDVGNDYYLFVHKLNSFSSRIGYCVSVRPSPKQKQYIERYLQQGARLFRTSDPTFLGGPNIGRGWVTPKDPERLDKLRRIFEEHEQVKIATIEVKRAKLPEVATEWVQRKLNAVYPLIAGHSLSDEAVERYFNEVFDDLVIVHVDQPKPESGYLANYLRNGWIDAANPREPIHVHMARGFGQICAGMDPENPLNNWNQFAHKFKAFLAHELTHLNQFKSLRMDMFSRGEYDKHLDVIDKGLTDPEQDGIKYLSNNQEIGAYARTCIEELRHKGYTDAKILRGMRDRGVLRLVRHDSPSLAKYLDVAKVTKSDAILHKFILNVVRALDGKDEPISEQEHRETEEIEAAMRQPLKSAKLAADETPKWLLKQYKKRNIPEEHAHSTWKVMQETRGSKAAANLTIAKDNGFEVTSEGKLVLYHGTRSEKAIRKSGLLHEHSWLSAKESDAKRYAQAAQKRGPATVMRLEVDPSLGNLSPNGYFSASDPIPVGAPKIANSSPLDNPAFKAWFGKSRIVDAEGNPLPVFHGTDATFDTFDRAHSKSGPSKFGFWFTSDGSFAEMFGANKMEVFLKIERPYTITSGKWNDIRDLHAKDTAWFERWRDSIISKGYDGLVVVGETFTSSRGMQLNDPSVYAVFNANQIKSVQNTGDFDPGKESILASKQASDRITRAKKLIAADVPMTESPEDDEDLPLEDALSEAEGDKDALLRVLNKHKARKARELPDRWLFTFGQPGRRGEDRQDTELVVIEKDYTVWFYRSAREFVSDADLGTYGIPGLEDQFNTGFWSSPSDLYHATDSFNLESIMEEGLGVSSKTRGLSNRSVGAAVFTSTNPDELDIYGDALLKIDTEAMARDGERPLVEREPDVVEGEQRESLAHSLGISYHYEYEQGVSPDTIIVNGHIPAKYLTIVQGDLPGDEGSDPASKQGGVKSAAPTENKIQNMMRSYGLTRDQVDQAIAADPSPNQTDFCSWICKQIKAGTIRLPEDSQKIQNQLKLFTRLKRSPRFTGEKDIQRYTPATLYTLLQEQTDAVSKKQDTRDLKLEGRPGAEIIYNQDGLVVYKVTDVEALIELSSNTNWCTTQPKNAEEYLSKGPNYVIFKEGKPYAQWDPNSNQLMNPQDKEIRGQEWPYILKDPILTPLVKALPQVFSSVYTEMPSIDEITKSALLSFQYARYVIKGRFLEGEPTIRQNPERAYFYARDVIKGRWPEGEPAIAQNSRWAYSYASNIIKGRWPEGEPAIAQNPQWAYAYAMGLSSRFPAGEPTIARDPEWAYAYAVDLIDGRFPEAEPTLAEDPQWAYSYALYVIKGRFPEGEPAIAQDPKQAYCYARDVIKGRWPEAEPAITRDPKLFAEYTERFLGPKQRPSATPATEQKQSSWLFQPDGEGSEANKIAAAITEAQAKQGDLKFAARVRSISRREARERNLFGPVYHGTSDEARKAIEDEGFKFFEAESGAGGSSNGYLKTDYWGGAPAPVHHLGFGIYMTTVKNIAKMFNGGSTKGLIEYYIDAPRVETINFAAPKTMMQWWVKNGYDPQLAKTDRVAATKKLTETLSSQYDAIWFKGKTLRKALDGDQVVVFDPDRIYKVDDSLSEPGEIGSTVWRKADGMRGVIEDVRELPERFREYHDGADRLLGVKWQKGRDHNVKPQDIQFENPKPKPAKKTKAKLLQAALPMTETSAFKQWFANSQVVNPGNNQPLPVYHGTTHDFDKFSVGKSDSASHYGQGLYFTSSPQDAGDNYANVEGPDLTRRIDFLAEELVDKKRGQLDKAGEVYDYDELFEEAKEQARKKLIGKNQGIVMPCYLRITNPVIVSKNDGTWFSYEFNERTGRKSGTAVKLYRAFCAVCKKYGEDGDRRWSEVMEKIQDPEFSAAKWDETLRKTVFFEDAPGGTGQVLAETYRKAGYDGIIMDPTAHFTGMKIPAGTTHFIVWNPKQVKSATGNSGEFDGTKSSITSKLLITAVPIRETKHQEAIRKNREYTRIVEIDAAKFKALWEAQNKGEPLNWNPRRIENLKNLDSFNAYPQVFLNELGKIDVLDGRHRITTAANRGETIEVSVPEGVELPAEVLASRSITASAAGCDWRNTNTKSVVLGQLEHDFLDFIVLVGQYAEDPSYTGRRHCDLDMEKQVPVHYMPIAEAMKTFDVWGIDESDRGTPHIQELMEAIQKGTPLPPALAHQEHGLLDGRHRTNAAHRLGLPQIPFIYLQDTLLSPDGNGARDPKSKSIIAAPKPHLVSKKQYLQQNETCRIDPSFWTLIQGASNGKVIGTLGDFLHGKPLRDLFSAALNTPIMALTQPVHDGKYTTNEALDYFGAFGYYRGEPTIFINPRREELMPTLLEEAAHAMRASRGRKDPAQNFETLTMEAYTSLKGEQTAKKMVEHALSLVGRSPEWNHARAVFKAIEAGEEPYRGWEADYPSFLRYRDSQQVGKTAKFEHAIRRGEVSQEGAYFSTPGASTYFDEDMVGRDPDLHRYDLSAAHIADTQEPAIAAAILEEALKDDRLTAEERPRLEELLNDAKAGRPFIDYLANDELPLPDAAKRLGYDGILVWENDDVANPSSVFLWNVNTVKKASKLRAKLLQKNAAPMVIDAPGFRSWFKGSKAVNGWGRPKMMYHGTASDFDTFASKPSVNPQDTGDFGTGFYFHEDPKGAESYANQAAKANGGSGAHLMPVFIRALKSLVLRGPKDFQRLYDAAGGTEEYLDLPADQKRDLITRDLGYDSVYDAAYGQWCVYSPDQIKAAFGNSGQFSENHSITAAVELSRP